MRFLIDECPHESLVGVAHGTGFEATHVNHLGLSGKTDWELVNRILKDEFTFVTNNRVDFMRLFGKMELYAGLIVIVPNVVPSVQRALFEAAIPYLGGKALINSAIEVSIEGKTVKYVEYQIPTEQSCAKDPIQPVPGQACLSSGTSMPTQERFVALGRAKKRKILHSNCVFRLAIRAQ